MPEDKMSDYGLPYTVKCPECYAAPGRACFLYQGKSESRPWPHIVRGEFAVKSVAQPEKSIGATHA